MRAYLVRWGGIRPDPRCRAAGRLRCDKREEISCGLAAGLVADGQRKAAMPVIA